MVGVVALLAGGAVSAQGARFVVNSLGDAAASGPVDDGACDTGGTVGPDAECTLRAAIAEANGTPGPDVVDLTGVAGEIQLGSALPNLSSEVELRGPGADALTVRRSAADSFRIFTIALDAPPVEISGLTIANGRIAGTGLGGGGIFQGANSELTLREVVVRDNAAATGDPKQGGGIRSVGRLWIHDSTITGNTASSPGMDLGGGIHVGTSGAHLVMTNSTVSANTSGTHGGGVTVAGATAELTSVTLAGNTATGSLARDLRVTGVDGEAWIENVLFAGDAPSCAISSDGRITSSGHNLERAGSSCGLDAVGDLPDAGDPLLGPLDDNGGPTPTHAPRSGSPAIDAGTSAGLTTDQRGRARPVDLLGLIGVDDAADIGALERQWLPPAVASYAETVLADGPVGYWRFGEASGILAEDSSGNDNHGQYLNGPLLGQAGAIVGDTDTAARFDGVGGEMRVPSAPSLNVGATFTAEGWIKRSTETRTHPLLNKGGRGLHLVVMGAANGNEVWLRKTGVTTIARTTTGVPADGEYHHVVVTMDGAGTATIYIDGVDVTLPVAGQHLQVIESTALPLSFAGTGSTPADLDEFALYARALTEQEVQEHYDAAR
ncbi:MAG: LamG domain-containing protein [Solirubrobacteraceae bacterium]|nr:LamG domain-containing protein [Solirubrobacteraceae bacterium]